MKKETVGIINEGSENTFINNEVAGFDVAVKDRGIKNLWKNNKLQNPIREKWYQKWWGQLLLIIIGGIIVGIVLQLIIG